jgi:hypothetical protein
MIGPQGVFGQVSGQVLGPHVELVASHWQVLGLGVWLVLQLGAGFPGPPYAKHGPVPFVPWALHFPWSVVSLPNKVLQYLAQALFSPPPPPPLPCGVPL